MDASIHDHDHEKSSSTNITVTGYPSPVGYPYNYSQPYIAAPCYPDDDAYYRGGTPQQYQYSPFQLDDHHHNVDVAKLQRCVLMVTIAIIFSTGAMAFATWLLFGNEIPIFSVDSLIVPVFNATNSSLSAKFVVNTTIANYENDWLEFHLIGSRSRLLYKDVTIAKGETDWGGISLDIKDDGNYITELQTNETAMTEMAGNSDLLSSVFEDRKRGTVTFVLKSMVKASFKRDTMSRIAYFTIICEDLNVLFNNSDGTGKLVTNIENGQPKECLIFT